MNLKRLAIVLAILLGGMALYYNQAMSDNTTGENATKVEKSK